ncbi:hypothetical protein P4V43_04130 [Brevibacillus fortis]|uniref:Uncharacterized protein n=1 Tax=Brevibacillus fortis TaxID=2126352 RepID=A0A2P7VNM0_9BACL|nr:hypothetical protein [Brevibacillus fortis]MED1781005.1 hypothetical protein [Brevibacillus fortis]PSK00783.1 hypothetical protein C7R93_01685 [Brevibacillus fortis]
MNAWEANKRQLEIWRRTVAYEIEMMAPQSMPACEGFLERLVLFEKELENNARCPYSTTHGGNDTGSRPLLIQETEKSPVRTSP